MIICIVTSRKFKQALYSKYFKPGTLGDIKSWYELESIRIKFFSSHKVFNLILSIQTKNIRMLTRYFNDNFFICAYILVCFNKMFHSSKIPIIYTFKNKCDITSLSNFCIKHKILSIIRLSLTCLISLCSFICSSSSILALAQRPLADRLTKLFFQDLHQL